jgi:large subunit ribosomal protein L19
MIAEEILQKIKPGAKVKVWERIKEGDKERQSAFEGIVISRKHGNEPGATFAVRAILHEVGVEKTYPIHSPVISKIEIKSSPKKVSRSKIYYIRHISGKRIREKLGVSI